ncbi:UpxY family transcription antiterminator [Bacteroidota bacterium]
MHRIDKKYHWYAIYTITNHEKAVNDYLEKCNIESFLPLTRTLKQWSDRKKWVDTPVFQSYVFVKVSCLEYYKVLAHPSALKYVCFESIATPIPEKQIEALKQVINGNLQYETTSRKFIPGQKVTISHGPFLNYEAEIIKYNGNKKALIRIDNIGYSLILNAPNIYLKDTELVI